MQLSVVIPVYNAERSICQLVDNLKEVLHAVKFEVVLVNDGSIDNSEQKCLELAVLHPEVSFVSLRKNFGEHNAVMCGLNFTCGEYVVIIDDDFQNPPSEILILLKEIESGYDVVYSKYKDKKHSLIRNLYSMITNKIANVLIDKPSELYLSSFKIIRSEVVSEVVKYNGPFPYLDGLILRVTNNIGSKYVQHNERMEGKSNYTFRKLFSLYLNMVLNFSIKPLRVFTLLGGGIFIIGILMSIYFAIVKILYNEVPGWTSIVLIIITFSGFQILFLGLIGEYIGKLYMDQNGKPQWVIKQKRLNRTKI